MCCCFSDIIKLEDFDLNNIKWKITWKYFDFDISYKTLIDPKPLRIRFNKIDGFLRIFDGTRYLTLFGCEKCDAIYDRIRHFHKSKMWHHRCFFSLFYEN